MARVDSLGDLGCVAPVGLLYLEVSSVVTAALARLAGDVPPGSLVGSADQSP